METADKLHSYQFAFYPQRRPWPRDTAAAAQKHEGCVEMSTLSLSLSLGTHTGNGNKMTVCDENPRWWETYLENSTGGSLPRDSLSLSLYISIRYIYVQCSSRVKRERERERERERGTRGHWAKNDNYTILVLQLKAANFRERPFSCFGGFENFRMQILGMGRQICPTVYV